VIIGNDLIFETVHTNRALRTRILI